MAQRTDPPWHDWPPEFIEDGLTYREFDYLYPRVKERRPDVDWSRTDQLLEELIATRDRGIQIQIINEILRYMKEKCPREYNEELHRMRNFEVVVDLPHGMPQNVPIPPYSYVRELKENLVSLSGIPVSHQLLFYNCALLENDQTLDHYHINRDDILVLMDGRRVDDFGVFVKGITNRWFVVRGLSRNSTVKYLKQKITEIEGVDQHRQNLVFKAKTLMDHHTLNFYGISIGAIIFLTLRFMGG